MGGAASGDEVGVSVYEGGAPCSTVQTPTCHQWSVHGGATSDQCNGGVLSLLATTPQHYTQTGHASRAAAYQCN